MLEEATAAYSGALDDQVFDYLEERGLDVETVASYRLGVVDDPYPGHEHLRGWLCIPYLDKDGAPLKLRFRRMFSSDEPKYLDLPEALPRLYNVGAVHRAADAGDTIHVAEGELDALILEQLGLPAVAVPGSDAWKPHHRRMLGGFSRVWIWADPDTAGHKLAGVITQSMRSAKVVRLTDGDVGETFLNEGPEYLYNLVDLEWAA